MESGRGRGRERGRSDVSHLRGQHNWRWEIRGNPTHRRPSRGPRDPHVPHRYAEPSGRQPVKSRLVGSYGGYDDAWGSGKDVKIQGEDSRRFLNSKGGKKSFRDLFSPKDVDEGGKWTEVKRRRVPRQPRDRSPIIKRPCFRCGLEGHIRRNCPRRLKMRCYGCNSASHLIKNCTAIHRPEEKEVELKSVSDITDRVHQLCKYAIFRARGTVNIHSLRSAMIERLWEAPWQGRIFPIDRNSFLVGFSQVHWRDYAVLAGRVDFGEFSGSFYAWDENWGAMQVLRPVIVWITMIGLPLHFWGKEEIKSIFASFGKVHKLGDNFYKKERADYVKAMVEVDDISLVPKTVKCSYKALTDERVRVYPVSLIPAATCLPVSQWNDETYASYAEDGGSGGYVEQNWSRREEVPRRAPRREEAGGGDGDGEAEADSTQAPHHVPLNAAMNVGAGAERQAAFRDPVVALADLVEEERERRRKGKGIQIPGNIGPAEREGLNRPINISSGSGSCDPNVVGAHVAHESAGSDDADSKAGPRREVKPQGGLSQDIDMGGEGPATGERQRETVGGAGSPDGGVVLRDHVDVGVDQVVQHAAKRAPNLAQEAVKVTGREGDDGTMRVVDGGGKSSSMSVPPGFRKINKSKDMPGASSPFGKMQRGGFKFLKRSASSGSSGLRQGQSQAKKNRPIRSMSNQEIEDVAANVGVVGKLSEEQISSFKELERKRASE